ncbi:MAG: hypothetical protein WBE26_03175 [Phycisphaerae bacterium]
MTIPLPNRDREGAANLPDCDPVGAPEGAPRTTGPLPYGRGSEWIDATDRQIDNLVYELYDLTDEEIRIVEEATQR